MFRALILLVDLIVVIILSIPTILCGLYSMFVVKKKKEIGAILHLSCGSSTQGVLDKFGSLNNIFDYDGEATKGVFNKNILFWFASRNSLRFTFANGWMILEQRKVFGLLPIASIFISFIRLFQLIRLENIKLIRGWDPYFSGVTASILHYMFKIHFCISIHTDYDQCYQLDASRGAPTLFGSRWLPKEIRQFVLSRADMVLPIREHLRKQLVAEGVSADRIRVIPHGVDIKLFTNDANIDLRRELSLPDGKAILSFVGRLSRENYVDDILSLTRRLAQKRNDFVIVMAGDGVEGARLKTEVQRDPQLNANIIMPGFLPYHKVIALRQASHVNLCLMGGFSLIEACASGRPVVAYDVDWHNELIVNDKSGFLIKEGNVEALCAAVEFLLDHPENARCLGEAARHIVFERHNDERTNAIKRKAYQDLISIQ